MNEELDSQLSAMFDDELAPAECELLARRLSRDEQLKARWGRYAVIGAAIRSERGVRLTAALASRVNAVVSSEPAHASAGAVQRSARGLRWWQPLAGGALAASVAAASILWLRAQDSGTATVQLAARDAAPRLTQPGSAGPESYVTPKPPLIPHPRQVQGTELANYVIMHSMYSPPMTRGNLLSNFVGGEGGGSEPIPAANAPASDLKTNVR
jgi:sigma-E factor negative regulatory protein RseA